MHMHESQNKRNSQKLGRKQQLNNFQQKKALFRATHIFFNLLKFIMISNARPYVGLCVRPLAIMLLTKRFFGFETWRSQSKKVAYLGRPLPNF